jgi:two-component system LytT family sensor kinase
LLRGVLRSEGDFSTLGRELEVVEAYLDIERARFEDRLRVRIDVPPSLKDFRVPVLLLQPIVENAVKHGIAATEDGGDVIVKARMESFKGARQLVIVVDDSGVGISEEVLRRGRRSGVGLRNVERRLFYQYGHGAKLSIDSTPGRGTTVKVLIPVASATRAEPSAQVAL